MAETRKVRILGLQLAAEQGDAGSQLLLAAMYAYGEGVEKNEAKAARLYG
jgi:TPR repeat protein